jgi:3-oxo-5-alpha-steroid 4-dehydrogenase 1
MIHFTFSSFVWVWMALAAIVHVTMFFVTAPFGRHTTHTWGPTIDNRLGWFVMELPSLVIMAYFLLFGTRTPGSYTWVLFLFWIGHYINRTIIYPLRIRPTEKRMPLVIALNAILFNLINAGLNGYYLSHLADPTSYAAAWLSSTHFLVGAMLFVGGMAINLKADAMLIALRRPGETGYQIPKGFLFRYISSPNLFGEIIEWAGFALMAWNLPALSFAIWTFANLVPRARNHHQWYQRTFPDYPKERKAVLPWVF